MKVNDVTVAKIAFVAGNKNVFIGENGQPLSPRNYKLNEEGFQAFIASEEGIHLVEEGSENDIYVISNSFAEKYRKAFIEAQKPVSLLISERTSIVQVHLNEDKLLEKADSLAAFIPVELFESFKKYVANADDAIDSLAFETAKARIADWITEKPFDYMGLLESRVVYNDYTMLCNALVFSDMQTAHACDDSPLNVLDERIFFGAVTLRATQAGIPLRVHINTDDSLQTAIIKWQLEKAGFSPIDRLNFLYNPLTKAVTA